jgi:uncharacterized membrane protein YphA (DoxX/SURF4 family)
MRLQLLEHVRICVRSPMPTDENGTRGTLRSLEGPAGERSAVRWTPLARVGFRFIFCYLILYCLYLANFLQVILSRASDWSWRSEGFASPLWHRVVPWFGQHVLHLRSAITNFSNGSGDTTYDYCLVLCELAIAALATVVWSIFDRNRPNYRTLHQWLRLMVRLSLADELFTYGTVKVIPLQFGTMPWSTQVRQVGEMSPATLLWTFMAASSAYTVFSGAAELLGGILVLIPCAVALGALVSFAALSNVLALNLCYDVPVKLKTFHLVLLTVFLLAPELTRLADVFFFNRTAQPAAFAVFSTRKWINRTAVIFPMIWGILLFSFFMFFNYRSWSALEAQNADRGPLYGVWQVEQFSNGGPLFTAKLRQDMQIAPGEESWQRVLFETNKTVVLQLKGGVFDQVDASIDLDNGSLSFSDSGDPNWRCTFRLQKPTASILNLHGSANGVPLDVTLHRVDDSNYPLTTRGFHWISEQPFFN